MGLRAWAAWLSRRRSPLEAWQRPSATVRGGVGRALIRGGRVLVGRAALSVRHLIIGGYVYLKHHIIGFTPMLKVDDIK